jgi:hypothetical protein
LLQAGFLLLFISSMPKFGPPANLARELTLILSRLPVAATPTASRATSSKTRTPILPQSPQPVVPEVSATPPAVAPGIATFGQSLFGCAPEAYASLTPDRQIRCPRPSAGVAIQEAPNLMGGPSHVKDEAHWQAELAREQSPALLPCGFNLMCLLGKIADGSLSDFGDPRTWPNYEIKQLQPEDFYKVEQAYDAWHKAHPADAPHG